MVIGHFTATYMILHKTTKTRPSPGLLLIAVIGAYLPDLIDKPLALLFPEFGEKGLGHSLIIFLTNLTLFGPILFAIKNKKFLLHYKFFLIGHLFHLIQDVTPLSVLLLPFGGKLPEKEGISLIQMVLNFYWYKISYLTFIEHIFNFWFLAHFYKINIKSLFLKTKEA